MRRKQHECEGTRYKQTQISSYFKVRMQHSSSQTSSIMKKRRKPRPLSPSTVSSVTVISDVSSTCRFPYKLPRYGVAKENDSDQSTTHKSPLEKLTVIEKISHSQPDDFLLSDLTVDTSSSSSEEFETSLQWKGKGNTLNKSLTTHSTKSVFKSDVYNEESQQKLTTKLDTKPMKVLDQTQILNQTNITSSLVCDKVDVSTFVCSTPKKNLTIQEKNITILQDMIITPKKAKNVPSPKSTPKISSIKSPRKSKAENEEGEETVTQLVASKWFIKIVQFLTEHSHFRTLLTGSNCEMLKAFLSMPNLYTFFCIKLYLRISKWYNIFKLCKLIKLEMSDAEVKDMYHFLVEKNFVEYDFSQEDNLVLLNALNAEDVRDICKDFKIKSPKQQKSSLIGLLLDYCSRQTTLTVNKNSADVLKDKIKQKMGICVKLAKPTYDLFYKVHLLYSFTEDFQTTSDLYFFIGRMLSKDTFIPEFRMDDKYVVFPSIEEFQKFSEALQCKQSMEKAFEKKCIVLMEANARSALEKLQEIINEPLPDKPLFLMRYTAGYQYVKILTTAVKHLPRVHATFCKKILDALLSQTHFCQNMRGLWYCLSVKNHSLLKEYEKATETLITALQIPHLTDVELYELNERAEIIKRKRNKVSELIRNNISFAQPQSLQEIPSIEIDAKAIRSNQSGLKRRYVEKTENETRLLSVEQIAATHYKKNGYTDCVHCEGSLLTNILFLLFWDVIYECYVPGVFINEIQWLPLDFYTIEFYDNRKDAIDRRLQEIRLDWPLDNLKLFLDDTLSQHAYQKSLYNDQLLDDPSDIFDLILCIGRERLAAMLERVIKNFKVYHSGLPDLFAWNVEKKKCKFVEVKGENDKLSTKQTLWLNFLKDLGADVEVCHVHTMGSKRRLYNKIKTAE